jgi:hypothetical protein
MRLVNEVRNLEVLADALVLFLEEVRKLFRT